VRRIIKPKPTKMTSFKYFISWIYFIFSILSSSYSLATSYSSSSRDFPISFPHHADYAVSVASFTIRFMTLAPRFNTSSMPHRSLRPSVAPSTLHQRSLVVHRVVPSCSDPPSNVLDSDEQEPRPRPTEIPTAGVPCIEKAAGEKSPTFTGGRRRARRSTRGRCPSPCTSRDSPAFLP